VRREELLGLSTDRRTNCSELTSANAIPFVGFPAHAFIPKTA